MPMAAVERGPPALEHAADDRRAHRQHARRAGRGGRRGGQHAAGRRSDPIPPGGDHAARPSRAGAARLRMLLGGQARVRPPAALARPGRGATTVRLHPGEHGGNPRGVGGICADVTSCRGDDDVPGAARPRQTDPGGDRK